MDNNQTNNKNLFNPESIVDDLWKGCLQLELIGCKKETESLLEKIVSFSNYQHADAINKLCQLYENNSEEKLNCLLENASLYALINNSEEKFLHYFSKVLTRKNINFNNLEIALSLYAQKSEKYFKENDFFERKKDGKIDICILATINQTDDHYRYLEKIVKNYTQEENINLSIYFIEDGASDKELNIGSSNINVLESYHTTVYQQDRFQSSIKSLDDAITFLKLNPFDALLFFEPLQCSILNYLLALHPCNFMVGYFDEPICFPIGLDLAITNSEVSFYDNTPYFKVQFDNSDIFQIVLEEFYKKNPLFTPNEEAPKKESISPKEKDFDKINDNDLDQNKKKDKKKENKVHLDRNIINQATKFTPHIDKHPLAIIQEQRKKKFNPEKHQPKNMGYNLSDTTNTVISKEEVADFWNKHTYNSEKKQDNGVDKKYDLIVDSAIKLLQEKNPKKALEELSKLDKVEEPIKDFFFVKALCYVSEKNYFKALNAIQSEISSFPNQQKSQILLKEIEKALEKQS